MSWLQAIFSAIAEFFGWKKQNDLLDAGKAAQAGDDARATLDAVKIVRAPITPAERDSVWARLEAEREAKRRVPADPKP